jgi:hypothetical protein
MLYKGNWANDLKEGPGELFYPEGDVVICTWERDRIHGEGTYVTVEGGKVKTVWYYDLMVPLDN